MLSPVSGLHDCGRRHPALTPRAATVEESVKVTLVKCDRVAKCCCVDWRARVASPHALLMFIVAGALGFSTGAGAPTGEGLPLE